MAIQAQNTDLSVTPGGIIPVVHVSQYDVDRVLTFTLMDGNNAASLPSGASVVIEGTKPSRHGFSYSDAAIVSLSGNVVTVNTNQQMTAEQGTVECKIKITAGDQVVGTALFLMEVEQAGVNDSTIVSDTELPAIIAMATAQMEAAEAAAEAAADSAQEAEDYKIYANTAAEIAKSWATYSTDANVYGNNTDNAHYWSDQAASKYSDMIAAIGTALNKINSFEALMELLFGAIYLTTESGDILTTESGDRIIIDY